MVDEFSRFGLLLNFYSTLHRGEPVSIKSIQREIMLQNTVGAICNEISQKASNATVQQLDGAYIRVKLVKNEKSFGYMYSLLEDMKTKFSIKEY